MFLLDLLRKRSRPGDHHKEQVHYLTTLRGVIGMLRNPEGTMSIYDIENGLLDLEATKMVEGYAKSHPEVAAIIEERYLTEETPDLNVLAKLDEGTLGKAYWHHIEDHGFDPDYFQKMDVKTDVDYILKRVRQTHDIWHVVLDIDTSRLGEIAVKAFELSQTWRPLSAVITCGGMMRYLMKEPEQLGDAMAHISHGYQLGRLAEPFLAQKWEEAWDKPLVEWRAALNLPAEIPPPGQLQPPCSKQES